MKLRKFVSCPRDVLVADRDNPKFSVLMHRKGEQLELSYAVALGVVHEDGTERVVKTQVVKRSSK